MVGAISLGREPKGMGIDGVRGDDGGRWLGAKVGPSPKPTFEQWDERAEWRSAVAHSGE